MTKNVEVGMNVQPGQQLLSIVPLDDVWVTANFKETQLKNMRPGQRVKITVDAFRPQIQRPRGQHRRRQRRALQFACRRKTPPGNYVKVVQRVPVKIVLDPGEE